MKTKNYLILYINNGVGLGGVSYCLNSPHPWSRLEEKINKKSHTEILIQLYLSQSIFIKTKVEGGDQFSKIFTLLSSWIKILNYFLQYYEWLFSPLVWLLNHTSLTSPQPLLKEHPKAMDCP